MAAERPQDVQKHRATGNHPGANVATPPESGELLQGRPS